MARGLAQVGILAVLTVIVLPCFLFTLLALLDRFERSLASDETVRAADAKLATVLPADLVIAAAFNVAAELAEPVGADVVALPVSVNVSPITPSAATG
jgi:hypothetical protein